MKPRVFSYKKAGFARDYYVGGKYQGYILIEQADRPTPGYYGRRTETLASDVVLKHSGKVIKAGTLVTTELIPMQGRVITESRK